ncbi:MAG: hypothetical protein ACKOAU_01970 [Pirellula sp.]
MTRRKNKTDGDLGMHLLWLTSLESALGQGQSRVFARVFSSNPESRNGDFVKNFTKSTDVL